MKVSVCIPTYNQAPYIERAILSAFDQSVPPFEIIVSNDCSTDNTADVLQRLTTEIPTLKVYNQPQNLGISGNTDTCLRLAEGDFVVRLDSDDYLSPQYIEKLSVLLLNNPEAAYAHSAVQEVDQHNGFLRQRRLARKSGIQGSDDALRSAIKGFRVSANILIFRREALAKINYVVSKADFAEDYYMVASLASAGYGNIYLDEILCYYRVWVDAGKVRQKRKIAEIRGYCKVFEEVLEPAYMRRNWSLLPIINSRTSFACRHSDCLSWDVYTKEEKLQLVKELNKLSSSPKARVFAWLYLNGFGMILKGYNDLRFFTKSKLKGLYIAIKK